MDAEDNPTPDILSDQSASVRIDSPISSSPTSDSETLSISKGVETSIVHYVEPLRNQSEGVETSIVPYVEPLRNQTVYTPKVHPPLGQPYYYKGVRHWEEYQGFLNTEEMDMRSQGIYPDNPSPMVQPGFGYAPQVQYSPYSHMNSFVGDSHFYPPQQYPFHAAAQYFRPTVPPSVPYTTAPSPISGTDVPPIATSDSFGPRPNFSLAPGAFPRANTPPDFNTFPTNNGHPGFDGFRSSHPLPEFTGYTNSQCPLPHLHPSASRPISTYGSCSNFSTALPQQQPFTFGTATNCFDRNGHHHCSNNDHGQGSSSFSCLGSNSQEWQRVENNRRNSRGRGSLYSNNDSSNGYPEQNRGPRALRQKNQNASVVNKTFDGKYNNPDFVTDYDKAKFFVIKSYSEDDIHQCIKYRVWASTTNGNRKLDAAYNDARQRRDNCPIFLFFSVNGSGQFCGVAEMIGPVDFDRSFGYWQQDKWSGQFPVKWHLVKDVPNTQFRHIILDNNEHRPVTSSRDTHEMVKVEQGVEMLKIFKSHEYKMSILDDYEHYEQRHKLLEERKAKAEGGGGSGSTARTLPDDALQDMSRSFAEAVAIHGGDGPTPTLPPPVV